MKLTGLLLLFALGAFSHSFAQQNKNPDTLVIGTKSGQIILVGDSLQKFNALNTNELIKMALYKVRDSLSLAEKKALIKQRKDSLYSRKISYKFPLRLLPVFGVGMVRDKFSPFLGVSLDFAPQRQDYYLKSGGMYTFINVAAVPYFTFEKESIDRYKVNRNVFLEASLGNRINNTNEYGPVSEFSAGLGYLVQESGAYYERNTFKVFVTVGIKKSFIKIKPELYFTDNFKSVFPGLSIKIF